MLYLSEQNSYRGNKLLKDINRITSKEIKFNDIIKNSFARDVMKNEAIPYTDNFTTSMFNDTKKTNYLGIRKLTIEEEVNSNINFNQDNKKSYDISKSYRRKYELMFEHDGKPISGLYVYIPFTDDKGIVISSDSRYQFIPVLTDTVITVSPRKIFIRLLRDKINIENETHTYAVNGELLHGTIDYTDRLYKNIKVKGKVGDVHTPISCYIFYKYRIKDILGRDIKFFIGSNREINRYKDDYDIYESLGKPPKGRFLDGYNSSNLKILIKKGEKLTPLEYNTLTAIFYVTDIFPAMCKTLVAIINNDRVVEEQRFWLIALSRLVFRDSIDLSTATEAISSHLEGLNGYIDPLIDKRLKEGGIVVNDFYDLLHYISREGTNMKLKHQKVYETIDDKYLDILYYIMFPLIVSVNTAVTKLNASERKGKLTYDTASSIIRECIRPRCIFNGFKTNAMCIAIQPLDTTIDWAGGNTTNAMDIQCRADGVIKNTVKEKFPLEKRHLIASDLFIGSILHFPKDWPTPVANFNAYAKIDAISKKLMVSEEDEEFMYVLNHLLSGKNITEFNYKGGK